MQFISSLYWIVIGVGFSMIGDVFLKKSQTTNHWYLLLGILLYACGAVPVAIAFKKIDFGPVFIIWEALTVLLAIIIASVYFKESFTMYKGLALLFALSALYFAYK